VTSNLKGGHTMTDLSGIIKRVKTIFNQMIEKDSDCRVEQSENGELVIYTGLVKAGKRYRIAKPEEQMDYVSPEELQNFLKKN
jgi:hypothetical protein